MKEVKSRKKVNEVKEVEERTHTVRTTIGGREVFRRHGEAADSTKVVEPVVVAPRHHVDDEHLVKKTDIVVQ